MKRSFFYLLCLCASVLSFASQQQLSPATKLWLQSRHLSSAMSESDSLVEAFVAFDNPRVSALLEQSGAKVNARFSDFATVSIPASKVSALSDVAGVKKIDVSNRVHLLTNMAASTTEALAVHEGIDLPAAFTGKGVVVGVVDVGIDFNHRVFLDAALSNRVKRVYLPYSTQGTPVDGLPGSEFAGDAIKNLTCDINGSHGTHTSGIAAGSSVQSTVGTSTVCYRGMAPDADLVLCALGNDLSEVSVVNAVEYIARYAAAENKPCVINMSLGNHDGPHDGTGFMARAFDEIVAKYPRVIIVVAAGNEGETAMYVRKTISPQSSLSTILGNSNAEVDAWNSSSKPFAVQFHLFDRNNATLVYSTDVIHADTTITSTANEQIAKIAKSGNIAVTFSENDVTGHSRIFFKSTMRLNTSYYIGITYNSADETDLRVWECTGSSSFQSFGMPGFTAGSDECSISDMATGKHTISVGAYVNRRSHLNYQGSIVTDTYADVGSISYFSSSGVDVNGVPHPFITAPGTAVVSSVNSHLALSASCAMIVPDATGRSCYWGVMSGTSMATPCVTGIVALWLEANPYLNVQQVKEVMVASADVPADASNIRWGNGKINARKGIQIVLASGLPSVDANHAISLVRTGTDIILSSADASALRATVYDINGQPVAQNHATHKLSISLAHLPKGIYILRAESSRANQSFKLLIND